MTYLDDVADRLLEMAQEAVAGTATIPGVNYWPYTQEELPYFFVRLQEDTGELWLAEDIRLLQYVFDVALVLGHADEGYEGQLPQKVYTYVPALNDFFDQNDLMTTTLSPTPLDNLDPRGVEFTRFAGPVFLNNSGIGIPNQMVVRGSVAVPVIRQRY